MLHDKFKQATTHLLEKIIKHPFNQELATGCLEESTFIFYLQQDSYYLNAFSRALAYTAARLQNNHFSQQFLQFSLEAIIAEKKLHSDYLHQYQNKEIYNKPSPTCFMYSNYLLQVSMAKAVEESVACLLPCFWVYYEVGKIVATISQPLKTNPYQRWIDLYAGEDFKRTTLLAINVINYLYDQATLTMQTKMINAFLQSTKLEWLFWDSAYKQEKWQI